MLWKQTECIKEIHENSGCDGTLLNCDVRDAELSIYAGKAQCVYMDPPFCTGSDFSYKMRVGEKGWDSGKPYLTLPAYCDRAIAGRDGYLALLRTALLRARELLTDTGSCFLQMDSRMGAYGKLLMDDVFGEKNFVNEIIWSYQSGGRSVKHFSRKHDSIYFYAKNISACYFDLASVPCARREERDNHMKKHVDEQGRSYRTIKSGGKTYTYYDDEPVYPGDVWTDISHLQQKDPQRTGYETQKPQALLDRIILSTTKKGDLVADLFTGSGTTPASAAQNNRRYIGLDAGKCAIAVARKRLLDTHLTLDGPMENVNAMLDATISTGIGYYDIVLNEFLLPASDLSSAGLMPSDYRVNALDAVDQWSVGFLKNGVFHAYVSSVRTRQYPKLKSHLELPVFSGKAALEIVDVLGRRSLWVCEQ